jgi:hypothetical protein
MSSLSPGDGQYSPLQPGNDANKAHDNLHYLLYFSTFDIRLAARVMRAIYNDDAQQNEVLF